MLDLILGNAPDAFSCGEVSAWFRPYRTHHFKIDCVCGEDPCPVWEKVKGVPASDFHAAVIEQFRVNFVIDSSKDLCWIIDTQKWAVANGIIPLNLLIWKDPIDLAYSYWKRDRDITGWRREFIRYCSKILGIRLPFLGVNYGNLVSNPRSTVAETCAAIGMPYFDGKERFWEKKHHHLFGSHGVRRQVETGTSIIRARGTLPQEFEANAEFLRRQVAADAEVQRILGILRQADVKSAVGDGSRIQGLLPEKPLPLWYYLRRTQRRIRRYFPQEFDPTTTGVSRSRSA
jgi:hypothetical protein